jgi:hypothetical protein
MLFARGSRGALGLRTEMSVPEHLLRFPTKEARVRLAQLLRLPYHESMQDWEWEVAEANRVAEFLHTYESSDLSEDEQFSLMEIIIQSVEDSETACDSAEWQRVLRHLDERISLHAHSVWYWAVPGEKDQEAHWCVTPDMRQLLVKHHHRLAQQTAARDRAKRGA